jgi:hypothetical protein
MLGGMLAPARLAALLVLTVTLVSLALAAGAMRADDFADSRLLDAGWVIVPVVGAAAYLGARWGIAAALGALAAPVAGALVTGWSDSAPRLFAAAGVLAVAVAVGHLARLAERHEHG